VALKAADAVIVSTALKVIGSWSAEALESDWDPAQVRAFVAAAALQS
jgi:predicted TIM-barrel enzyme